jgi:hypothetical protein
MLKLYMPEENTSSFDIPCSIFDIFFLFIWWDAPGYWLFTLSASPCKSKRLSLFLALIPRICSIIGPRFKRYHPIWSSRH